MVWSHLSWTLFIPSGGAGIMFWFCYASPYVSELSTYSVIPALLEVREMRSQCANMKLKLGTKTGLKTPEVSNSSLSHPKLCVGCCKKRPRNKKTGQNTPAKVYCLHPSWPVTYFECRKPLLKKTAYGLLKGQFVLRNRPFSGIAKSADVHAVRQEEAGCCCWCCLNTAQAPEVLQLKTRQKVLLSWLHERNNFKFEAVTKPWHLPIFICCSRIVDVWYSVQAHGGISTSKRRAILSCTQRHYQPQIRYSLCSRRTVVSACA